MNRYVVKKKSLSGLVKNTVNKNSDIRFHHQTFLRFIKNRPLRINYINMHKVNVRLELEVRFGINVIETVNKISEEVRKNLEQLTGVSVKSIEIVVKDIFNEE